MGCMFQMPFVEPLKRLRRTQFKNHCSGALVQKSLLYATHALWIWCRHLNVASRLRVSLVHDRCFHTVICSAPSLLCNSVISVWICWLYVRSVAVKLRSQVCSDLPCAVPNKLYTMILLLHKNVVQECLLRQRQIYASKCTFIFISMYQRQKQTVLQAFILADHRMHYVCRCSTSGGDE